jgi:hypothetical protein
MLNHRASACSCYFQNDNECYCGGFGVQHYQASHRSRIYRLNLGPWQAEITDLSVHLTWGRCYDNNFLRFLPIFGKKLAFSQKPML